MECMEEATRAAVASLQDRLTTLEEENRALRDSMVQQNYTISQQLRQQNEYLMLILANRNANQQPVPDNQPAAPPQEPPLQQGDVDDDEIPVPSEGEDEAEEAPPRGAAGDAPAAAVGVAPAVPAPPLPPPLTMRPGETAADLQWREARAIDAPAQLRSTPRQPPLPQRCPPRWHTNYRDWHSQRLWRWRDKSQEGWEHRIKLAYNKRLAIFKEIERAAAENMTGEERASRYLDDNRKELTLNFTEHLEHRKRQNPAHDRRVSGPRAWRRRPTRQQPALLPGRGRHRRPPRQQPTPPRIPPPPPGGRPYQPSQHARQMMDATLQERLRVQAHLMMARRRAAYVTQMEALDEGEVEAARAMHGYPPI